MRIANMCGFVGIIKSPECSREEVADVILRMNNTLVHRGPDDFGCFVDDIVAFGHRRLSILERSIAGAQPMRLGSNGPILVFNGEIYNFLELRNRLEAIGHSNWIGRSDTEVILRVYSEWGLDGLRKLEGIFALAIWDPSHHRLILMRDRLGIKPLYYGETKYGFAFGSEIKAIISAGGVDVRLDDQTLAEYIWYGNAFESRTFYKGIRSLQPGEWMVIENNKRMIESWWKIEQWLHQPINAKNIYEASDILKNTLDYSVERQLVSDVPVGIFLSGGIDSSTIAASAVRATNLQLDSYCASFDFSENTNEAPKAARTASHLNLNHHEFKVRTGDLEAILINLAKAHDEPFADAANIPLYLMCKELASIGTKVVLQGDGGDELFAGYRRHNLLFKLKWWQKIPSFIIKSMFLLGDFPSRIARIANAMKNADPALRMAYLLTVENQTRSPERVFNRDRRIHLLENADPFLAYRRAAERFSSFQPIQQMLLTDLTTELPYTFLNKVDRASMAAGIEARVPFLDERVVRLAVNIQSAWKVNSFEKKIILRHSQRERLPKEVLDGPKTGFSVPYDNWLRYPLYNFTRDHLLDKRFIDKFSIDASMVEKLLVQHRENAANNGFIIWKLLQMSLCSNIVKI